MRKDQIKREDFTKEKLPKTRISLFFDLLKNQTATIINTSLLTFLFALPLIALSIYLYITLVNAMVDEASFTTLFSIVFYGSLLSTPLIFVSFLGFLGSFYVAKRLAWGEGLLLRIHFFQGIKEELRRSIFLITIFIVSLLFFLNGGMYLAIFYQEMPILTGLGIAILGGQFLLILMTTFYFLAYQIIYQNTFFETFKNAFLMATGRLHFSLIFLIIFPGILILLILLHFISALIGLFFFALFSFIGVLLWTLLSQATFDLFINNKHYPEYVKKGLNVDSSTNKEEVG